MRAGTIVSIVSVVTVAAVTFACSGDRPAEPHDSAPAAVTASLGGVIVARVGDVPVDRALVLEVARAKKVSAADALDAVAIDVLLAKAAESRGGTADPSVEFRTASALSRAMLRDLRDKALAAPFTDEELAPVVTAQWLAVEHPELRRVVHALVKKDVPNARAVAGELRTALLAVKDEPPPKNEGAFMQAARAFKVPSGPAVHVESLQIAADGRVAEPGADGSVEEPFTKGAFAIADVLGTSEIVETTYGFHVIRLLQKTPPLSLTREEKIEKLRTELVANRVRPAHEQELAALRAKTKIEVVADDATLALPR